MSCPLELHAQITPKILLALTIKQQFLEWKFEWNLYCESLCNSVQRWANTNIKHTYNLLGWGKYSVKYRSIDTWTDWLKESQDRKDDSYDCNSYIIRCTLYINMVNILACSQNPNMCTLFITYWIEFNFNARRLSLLFWWLF